MKSNGRQISLLYFLNGLEKSVQKVQCQLEI